MVTYREQALWDLCRQGYPISADEAEICWNHGKPYLLEPSIHVSRALRTVIERCPSEVSGELVKHILH
jgi:hypothetical protein